MMMGHNAVKYEFQPSNSQREKVIKLVSQILCYVICIYMQDILTFINCMLIGMETGGAGESIASPESRRGMWEG